MTSKAEFLMPIYQCMQSSEEFIYCFVGFEHFIGLAHSNAARFTICIEPFDVEHFYSCLSDVHFGNMQVKRLIWVKGFIYFFKSLVETIFFIYIWIKLFISVPCSFFQSTQFWPFCYLHKLLFTFIVFETIGLCATNFCHLISINGVFA